MRRHLATAATNPSRRDAIGGAAALAVVGLAGCSRRAESQASSVRNEDDSDLLTRLIASPTPHIPRRATPYRLLRSLTLPPGRMITLDAGTRIIWVGATTSEEPSIGVFVAGGNNTGLRVNGGTAIIECAVPSTTVYAATMRGHRGFDVIGIEARDCQHVHVDSRARSYDAVITDGPGINVARDVRISGGGARFTAPQTEGQGACMLAYVVGGHIDRVHYENVPHGIQWWGGDAGVEFWQNGARANARKCRNLLIERASVRRAQTGGIWGSMGQDVTVRDCAASECLDVGFDAEGCNTTSFERCHARNCHNGCFTTFSLCDGVRFADCQGTVDRKEYPLFRIYNATQSNADNRNVTVTGGRFECLDRSGPSSMDTAMGPVQQLTITGASLVNVRIDTAFSNMRQTRITNNTLTFPVPLSGAAAIRVGGSKTITGEAQLTPGTALVENNYILYTAPAKSGRAIAIQLREDDFNSTAVSRAIGNVISGPFTVGVSVINATGNGAIVPSFVIAGNRFSGLARSARLLTVAQEGPVAKRPNVRWDDHQTLDGTAMSLSRALG